ncbi:M4 family metallopeptidase [Paracoccus tegillarcae]|uniref:Neutral metalloproteinase n=1 Tax=Paracoccus tegillarcae TaxID=1529068 RepID=A0A2K9EJU4_9RHOB|nr:M4 family metallopeptidase [Paracoccus tegillarcae]AUH35300.1 peptidase M4 family protein [Paracoccus tegillarcae]
MCFSVCSHASHHPINCIVPPHILRVVALRGDERTAEMARSLLKQSEQLREERQDHSHVTPPPPEGSPAAVRARAAGAVAASRYSPNRQIHDGQNKATLPGKLVREEGDDPCGIEDADRAYDAAGEVFALFGDEFDRDSLDGKGMPLIATVNHRRRYNNAFWDGEQMAYGNGDGQLFTTFIDLSVIAHEMTHGVIQHSGGLVYQDQSGALNESIADVFGTIALQRHKGQDVYQADWVIGGEILGPDINGVGLRSMKAPGTAYHDDLMGQDPQPFHMDNFLSTSDDHGGVHINSGIPNHAFYLYCMYMGSNSWEKPGQIWYRALQELNNPLASFAQWSDQTVAAAIELYGIGSLEVTMLRRAWKLVGLPT